MTKFEINLYKFVMETQNYIKDLENQYFELDTLIKNNQASQAQIERFDEISDELKGLPDNVLSQGKKREEEVQEKKTIKRKLKF